MSGIFGRVGADQDFRTRSYALKCASANHALTFRYIQEVLKAQVRHAGEAWGHEKVLLAGVK